jgi:hypothetical protein
MNPPTHPDDSHWFRTRRVLRTAEEWQSWDAMLPLLRPLPAVSDRKARLFECACLRRLWHAPELTPARPAVETWERLAEGMAAPEEAEAAARVLRHLREAVTIVMGGMWGQLFCDAEDHHPEPWPTALRTCEAMDVLAGRLVCRAAGLEDCRPDRDQRFAEERVQCDLIRCLFVNPFRPVSFQPAWLTPTVAGLAGGIYDERAFDRLPILGDALQDAGCADAALLAHCRAEGPHARGCWVVDLVLGKQ